ncbi:MAG: NUDIX hydrolase [Firmicutes bacterium]|nr:NUDIX hydrolase [Bacillota bacterium]
MSDIKKENYQLIETLIGVFTIEKGKIKILLVKKSKEPYKGYWQLPGSLVNNNETLEDNVSNVVIDKLGIPSLYVEQCYTFGEINRNPDNKVVAVSYIGLINSITLKLRQQITDEELEWFDIDSIPKTAYDHDKIIEKLISNFKSKIVNSNILKILFPSDFTLPELQKIYEQVLNKSLDRRNFRKKLMNLGYIEDTGDVYEGATGRPAKLYRFKEEIEEMDIF